MSNRLNPSGTNTTRENAGITADLKRDVCLADPALAHVMNHPQYLDIVPQHPDPMQQERRVVAPMVSTDEPLVCVLVRSDQQPIVVNLEIAAQEPPETVYWVDGLHQAP